MTNQTCEQYASCKKLATGYQEVRAGVITIKNFYCAKHQEKAVRSLGAPGYGNRTRTVSYHAIDNALKGSK